jgi:hypothetical protein
VEERADAARAAVPPPSPAAAVPVGSTSGWEVGREDVEQAEYG